MEEEAESLIFLFSCFLVRLVIIFVGWIGNNNIMGDGG